MRLTSCFIVCFAMLTVPAIADPTPDVKQEGSRVACAWSFDLEGAARVAHETACFKATGGVFRRDGDKVIIKLTTGAEVTIEDNFKACEEQSDACNRTFLTHFDASRSMAAIYHLGWETASSTVMDLKTGEVTDIGGTPFFSPAGNRVAAIVNDQTGDSDIEVFVVDIAQSPFKVLTKLKTGTLRGFAKVKVKTPNIDFVGWKGDTRINLRLSDGNDVEYSRVAYSVDAKGKWSLSRQK